MSTTYKISFNNPQKFKNYTNNSADLYNYQMCNVMDAMYDGAMDKSSEGIFKAVCLSGIKTEDNEGGSNSPSDGLIDQYGYARIIVKPLAPFGSLLPDPSSYTDPIEINQSILLHAGMFSARSDYLIAGVNMPQFGQVINCYYERGSVGKSLFTDLRFQESKIQEFDQNYVKLASIEGVRTGLEAFAGTGGHGALLGEMSENDFNPQHPPEQWRYLGADQKYYNSIIQNGNLPSELMAKTKIGVKIEPLMLIEIIPDFEALAAAFNKKFPTKTLGGFGYRTYKKQIKAKKEKPKLAATPGTSTHGRGQAVDIHYYDSTKEDPRKARSLGYHLDEYKWLAENAQKYNWYNPPWAQKGTKKEEPWHWESTRTIFKRV